uniref:Uncharacterized protein n=1 Tax=Rhizophora mucronata TaxID=61149 RepID=A0A2P2LP73_RHIMU
MEQYEELFDRKMNLRLHQLCSIGSLCLLLISNVFDVLLSYLIII